MKYYVCSALIAIIATQLSFACQFKSGELTELTRGEGELVKLDRAEESNMFVIQAQASFGKAIWNDKDTDGHVRYPFLYRVATEQHIRFLTELESDNPQMLKSNNWVWAPHGSRDIGKIVSSKFLDTSYYGDNNDVIYLAQTGHYKEALRYGSQGIVLCIVFNQPNKGRERYAWELTSDVVLPIYILSKKEIVLEQ